MKTFGWPTFTKTVTSGTVVLPNPWKMFPQTLTVDTEVPGDSGAAATHLVQSRAWHLWN